MGNINSDNNTHLHKELSASENTLPSYCIHTSSCVYLIFEEFIRVIND